MNLSDPPIDFHVNFWSFLFSLFGFILAVYGIAAARAKASSDDMDKIKAELNTQKGRIDIQEEKFRNTLSDQQLNAILTPKLAKLEGDLNGFGGRLDRMDERMKSALTLQQLNHELKGVYDLIRDIDKGVGTMQGHFGKLEEGLKATASTIAWMRDWLKEREK